MPELAPITPNSAQAQAVKLLWNRGLEKFSDRNARISLARQMLLGELKPYIPKEFEIPQEDRNKFLTQLPQGRTIPLKTVNVMQRKEPKLKRYPVGAGPRTDQQATKIERWILAQMGKLFDWDTAIDWSFNEAEVCIVTLPRPAGWEKVPSLYEVIEEPTGGWVEIETEHGPARIPETKKSERIRGMYARDEKGRRSTDPYYKKNRSREFKVNADSSAREYEAILEDYRAKNAPWEIQVIPATDCIPVFGPNRRLEGVVLKQTYQRNELLRKGLRWDGDDRLLEPTAQDPMQSIVAGKEVTVYTYIGMSEDGHPFLVYTVDGKPTRFQQTEDPERQVDAKICLLCEFGMTRLPVTYSYGWNFAHQDPAKRGVPFIWPFIPGLLGSDALASATVLHSWWTAFGGWFVEADSNLDPRAYIENGKPREVKMRPMQVQYVGGKVVPANHPGVGNDVHRMIALMMGAVEQEIPGGGGGAFGQPGQASSGHDRTLMRDYLEDAVSQTLRNLKEAFEYHASIILEYADCLTKKWDIGIPVFAPVNPGPQMGLDQKPNRNNVTREILTLEPGDLGINYEIEAYYPRLPGENIALAQQLAEFVKQKLATFEEFRTLAFGDENPEETRILIAVDEMLFETEIGRNYIMQLAFEYLGDERQSQMAKLIEQNLMLKNGMPTALMKGIFPDMQTGTPESGGGNPQNVMSGMGSQSPARQALGGVVAGGGEQASQNRDAQATAGSYA